MICPEREPQTNVGLQTTFNQIDRVLIERHHFSVLINFRICRRANIDAGYYLVGMVFSARITLPKSASENMMAINIGANNILYKTYKGQRNSTITTSIRYLGEERNDPCISSVSESQAVHTNWLNSLYYGDSIILG